MHTVESHGVKVQSLQVRQQEGIALRIPCAISYIHGVGTVDAAPRSREPVGRHGGCTFLVPAVQQGWMMPIPSMCNRSSASDGEQKKNMGPKMQQGNE